MIPDAIVSWIHYLGLMLFFGALTAQHLFIKGQLPAATVKRVFVLGIIGLVAAVLLIATGLIKWFVVGKGVEFYLKNGLFHTKLLLAFIATVLAVIALAKISRLKAEAANAETVTAPKGLHHLLRAALALVVIVPLLATLVARGVGYRAPQAETVSTTSQTPETAADNDAQSSQD